ncbi:hypothetical protein HOLleu_08143 [Holothuria leucospilota]|uniref:Uncharacterized protein n=1 Tax=Holothuria leucospilota TaxID=206669 RepID=A0A9Q1CH37_HOLLE|nr:hypothetical protein HOLleu_08143 [Holothuria leucospilota]
MQHIRVKTSCHKFGKLHQANSSASVKKSDLIVNSLCVGGKAFSCLDSKAQLHSLPFNVN